MAGASVTVKSYRKERETEITDKLRRALDKVGAVVERQAKINATHAKDSDQHPAVQTGRLRASISHNWSRSGKIRGDVEQEAKPEDGVSQPSEDLTVFIGTNVNYASDIELGHIQHPGQYVRAIGKRLTASDVPAYPFLFPAVESTKGRVIEILKGKT